MEYRYRYYKLNKVIARSKLISIGIYTFPDFEPNHISL